VEENYKLNQLICYCFDYTEEDIRKDMLANGRSMIMEEIKLARQIGGCQCQIKNPKGR
jgi:hypothetical protein